MADYEALSSSLFGGHFKLPFKRDFEYGIYIWDKEGNKVGMFMKNINEERFQKEFDELEEVINGTREQAQSLFSGRHFEYSGSNTDAIIYEIMDDGKRSKYIVIRGWGYLTSKNCEGLSNKEAAEVQDNVGDFIAGMLNGECRI